MDIVIPFRHSINKDEELRYTLRSLSVVLSGLDTCYVVGDRPRWAYSDNLVHYPMPDTSKSSQWRDRNIAFKSLKGAELMAGSLFLLAHDDNFLLPMPGEELRAEDWPHYWKDTWSGAGDYALVEANTKAALGINAKNYDVHAPHVVERDWFIMTIGELNWSLPYGYAIKSMYFNNKGINLGMQTTDLKIKSYLTIDQVLAAIRGRRFFSCDDAAWRHGVGATLKYLYPEPSKYER